MLDSWNSSIFSNIKQRLQDSAMKLVHAERNGEAFDSQLVIGVRESYGRCSEQEKSVTRKNLSSRFPIRFYTNQAVQAQKMARSLKFRIWKEGKLQ